MSSPTQRTLAECKKRGWRAQVVERWNAFAKRRVDLFGCIDVVVLDRRPGLLGIQATSTGNISSRVQKILTECGDAAREWLEAGNRLSVWGYAKRGPAGKRKLWTLKEREVTLEEVKQYTTE